MLLDRKRIKKWAKWVALVLAVIFAASFITMGVGYGATDFNLLASLSCSDSKTAEPESNEAKLEAYETALAANPNDTAALLGLANTFQDMYEAGEGEGAELLLASAAPLEKLIEVDPGQTDIYMRLARLYMDKAVADYAAAVKVLNKAASADPTNPEVFLKLGTAQSNVGNYSAAILAWQKYLSLEPNGEMAETVQAQIDKLKTTTTTAGASTTTSTTAGASSTTSTAASTTTTTAP